jgi:hypothetical protein
MSARQDASDEAQWRDQQLAANGLLDPDQPTESATVRHQRKMRAEFSAQERASIRSSLRWGLEVNKAW